MIRGLITIVSFCLLCTTSIQLAQAQNNVLSQRMEKMDLVIVVVDSDDFTQQDDIKNNNYKNRYYSSVEWFKNNWPSFIQTVRDQESYRVKMTSQEFSALSQSDKQKLEDLYSKCHTGLFDPVGLAISQMSSIKYNPKLKDNDQVYQKLTLSQNDIDEFIKDKNSIVITLNAQLANQIQAILH